MRYENLTNIGLHRPQLSMQALEQGLQVVGYALGISPARIPPSLPYIPKWCGMAWRFGILE